MTKIADLTGRARRLLQDNGIILRVPDHAILDWYNEAVGRVCSTNPFALTAVVSHGCSAQTLQTVQNGLRVLDVTRANPGRALTQVSEELLDREAPGWHDETPASGVFHWVPHAEETRFYLYPKPDNSVSVDVVVQKAPTEATRLTDTVELVQFYDDVLVDYLAYRCLLEDAENTINQGLASQYFEKFQTAVLMRYQQEASRRGLR